MTKAECRKITPPKWVYAGSWDGFFMFQSGNDATGFKLMRCLIEDLTSENLILMARFNLTR